ncbi:MAG TPA: hypothetical protein VGN84_10855 [Solirubrobacterales bacterium]|jgi:hypothetical protein|nr:hypothetical protein [Solirubrobacterales bacterium]
MHRTSKIGLAIGIALVAVGSLALAALTKTGAGGVYGFLFAGMFGYMVFLMWPERTRFRGRPFSRADRHGSAIHEPR